MSDAQDAPFTCKLEPPDIICLVIHGNLSREEDARSLVQEVLRCAEGREPVFILNDMSRAGPLSAKARSIVAERANHLQLAGIGIVGASFPIRVFATLIVKAIWLVGANSFPLEFFPTTAEARAWFSEVRARKRP